MKSPYRHILITGGAGFIGANFVSYLYETYPDPPKMTVVDALTYAGHLRNLEEFQQKPGFCFSQTDICDAPALEAVFQKDPVDAVVHFAAESHVDRSIADSQTFIRTNVLGTQVLLTVSLAHQVQRFVHVSTDEVYGSILEGAFTEESPIKPNSPYAASKAGSDLLVRAFWETYRFPIVITRCSNNYGPLQFPEKLIPVMVTNALQNKPLPVYGKGENVRDWIFVKDHCRGVDLALHKGQAGEVYNLGGAATTPNLTLVKKIVAILGKPESLITFVKDRLGHDFRYAIDFTKAKRELGFEPQKNLDTGLEETVSWYLKNTHWWD